jgi:hypothetical protein
MLGLYCAPTVVGAAGVIQAISRCSPDSSLIAMQWGNMVSIPSSMNQTHFHGSALQNALLSAFAEYSDIVSRS